MLVLSRKVDQRITIGDDVVLTVVRIDSHRVRIGIDAPKDVRILRGELAAKDFALESTESTESADEGQLSEREFAFAHPQDQRQQTLANDRLLQSDTPQLFAGTVAKDGSRVQLKPTGSAVAKSAPLAAFVSAT